VFSKLIKSNNNDFVVSYKENKSNFMYLIFILIFQNAYSILKIIFASNFGVNLDLIFQIILPIGTITVIVSLFIKNLLSSKVNDVFKAIKNIHGVIDSLMVFYYSKKEVAFDDYNFVSSLPSLIKTQILNNQISTKEASALIEKFDTTIKLIDQTYSKDEKQKKYM
jgi:hypothetical protein